MVAVLVQPLSSKPEQLPVVFTLQLSSVAQLVTEVPLAPLARKHAACGAQYG